MSISSLDRNPSVNYTSSPDLAEPADSKAPLLDAPLLESNSPIPTEAIDKVAFKVFSDSTNQLIKSAYNDNLPHLSNLEMIMGVYTFSSAERLDRLKIDPNPGIKKSLSDTFPSMTRTLKSIFASNAFYASLPPFTIWRLDLIMQMSRIIKAIESSRKLKADFKIKNSLSPQLYFRNFFSSIEKLRSVVNSYYKNPTAQNEAGVNKYSDWLRAMPEFLQNSLPLSLSNLLPPIRERLQLGIVLVDNIKLFEHILYLNSGVNCKLYPELAINFKHTRTNFFLFPRLLRSWDA